MRQETVNLNMITSLRQRIAELEVQIQEHLLKEPRFLSQLQEANLNVQESKFFLIILYMTSYFFE